MKINTKILVLCAARLNLQAEDEDNIELRRRANDVQARIQKIWDGAADSSTVPSEYVGSNSSGLTIGEQIERAMRELKKERTTKCKP